MSSTLLTRIVILPALALLASCGKPAYDPAPVFARWFIQPGSARLDSLSRFSRSARQWNSIAGSLRLPARPDADRMWKTLTDPTGTAYKLGIMTPASYRTDSLYPLLIYLHGGIGTASEDKGTKAYEMFAPLADSMPLFLASPSGSRNVPWWSPAGVERVLQCLRYMTLFYPVDPDRVILSGVSDGATGCYAVANVAAQPFAGFIAVSGYGGALPSLGMPLVTANLSQRPIYNVNAGRDRLYPAQQVLEFMEFLRKNGVPVSVRMYPEEEHGFDYRDREMQAMLGLVRTWKRPGGMAGFGWTFVRGYPAAATGIFDLRLDQLAESRTPFSGYWSADTLILRSEGIRGITLMLDRGPADCILVKSGDGPVTRIRNSSGSRAVLSAMLSRQYPAVPEQAGFYRIPVKR